MAKELPYFKFEPAEYLTKDISFCTLEAQGLFINICAFYWQRLCSLSRVQILRRFPYENALNELIEEGVIDLHDEEIRIKFLDQQLDDAIAKSEVNSRNGAKGGRPRKAKENQTESEKKPNALNSKSETKGKRREEKRKDEKRGDKKSKDERVAEFRELLAPFVGKYPNHELKKFFDYWTESGPNQTKLRYEFEKTFSIPHRLNTWMSKVKPEDMQTTKTVLL